MNYLKLALAVVICELAGIIGSLFTSISAWYLTLNKPWFNPPGWLFGPVWTVLYLLMGISLYMLYEKKANLLFFWVQLGLNTLWSFLFFYLHSPLLAFVDIVLLWIAIVFTIYYSYKASRKAAYLLLPYLLWVSFALILNGWIWLGN